MNTSLRVKKEHFKEFTDMILAQLEGGGKRYALGEDKEFTDLVCEVAGVDWIAGNITKYIGEIINAKKMGEKPQKVNFIKIATYAYLYYLKHLDTGFSEVDKGEMLNLKQGEKE